MSKLPSISGRECALALAKVGFRLRRQEGSHNGAEARQAICAGSGSRSQELDRGTLRAILRGAGVAVEEFLALLR